MIDAQACNTFNPNKQVRVAANRLFDAINDPQEDLQDHDSEDETSSYDSQGESDPKIAPKGSSVTARNRLTDDQLLRCHYAVRGYSLREKAWMDFDATKFHDIHFDSRAFDQLVLLKNHKTLF